jgi:ABC-type branched-subunit amino acid transport system permease subunit
MKGAWIALSARYGTALLLVVLAAVGPFLLSQFNLLQLSSFAAMGLATLGLALAWGYVGILSFGHAAFFGLGAYAYAIAAINFGDSTLAILLAVLLPAAFALLLGHFLFFGRVGDVYLAVITLCVTLILFSFMNSTADPWYRIGAATLGGFNGIDAVPPLNWPGKPDASLLPVDMFRLCFVALAVTYYLIGRLLRSDAGRILIAIRENELRSELVGYDVRLYKLFAFVVSAAVAGLGGPVYCQQRLCGPHGFRHQSGFRILALGHRRRSGHPGGADDRQFCLSISSDVPWHQPGLEYATRFWRHHHLLRTFGAARHSAVTP